MRKINPDDVDDINDDLKIEKAMEREKMANKNDGGPAFPVLNDHTKFSSGMSLRDYFAAKAMQSLINFYNLHDMGSDNFVTGLAQKSYNIADELIKESEFRIEDEG